MKKIALLMDLPEHKLSEFYALITTGLPPKVTLFDRDKEMLIVSTPEECYAVSELLIHHKIAYEEMELLLLPASAVLTALFTDYGFKGQAGHHYLYRNLVALFRFSFMSGPRSEPQQAMLQMEEFLLAQYICGDCEYYAVDQQLEPLLFGIAKAYHCEIELVVS